jgi:hypothetical protein
MMRINEGASGKAGKVAAGMDEASDVGKGFACLERNCCPVCVSACTVSIGAVFRIPLTVNDLP